MVGNHVIFNHAVPTKKKNDLSLSRCPIIVWVPTFDWINSHDTKIKNFLYLQYLAGANGGFTVYIFIWCPDIKKALQLCSLSLCKWTQLHPFCLGNQWAPSSLETEPSIHFVCIFKRAQIMQQMCVLASFPQIKSHFDTYEYVLIWVHKS